MKLNERLKVYREECGLSQEEVAERLNTSRQTISNWENGKSSPNAESIPRLAKLYGKTVNTLLHGTPEEEAEEQPEEAPEEQTEEAPEEQTEEAPEEQTEDVPEEAPDELMVEVPEETPIEPFEVVPEMPTTTQKKSLSVKTRALLLALTVLLTLAVGFAAGWYACDYARTHKVYEEQVDLSKPYDTLEFFPLEDN